MSDILLTHGMYFGKETLFVCDLECNKAWGINNRPRIWVKDPQQKVYPNEDFHDIEQEKEIDFDVDDYVYLADSELGDAPLNTGIYEGGEAKPFKPEVHNKWCVRECERCGIVSLKDLRVKSEVFHDYSKRCFNMSQEGK